MKITYINHSSFLVELEKKLLLFDYYSEGLPDDGIVPGLSRLLANQTKPLYVFVSHKHRDHFDRKIFGLEQMYPETRYILSKDTHMNEKYMRRLEIAESAWNKIQYMSRNEERELSGDMSVMTLASTDAGVAFLVKTEGRNIYHAGDLNWWSWKGETQAEAEDMQRRFQQEIAKLGSFLIDAAFLPLDPRQEEQFYWGFDYFMRHTDTRLAYPMHFWGDTSVIAKLKDLEISQPYRERIMEI